jgi:hypothetical protein
MAALDHSVKNAPLGVARHDISGVVGLDDRRQLEFDALSFEMRYRVLNRERAPFGLTFGADPHWGRVDDISGAPVDRYGTDFWIIADRELVQDKIFAAFNLLFQPEAIRSRETGTWEHQSRLGYSAAAVVQVFSGVLVGAEAATCVATTASPGCIRGAHLVCRANPLRKIFRTSLDICGLEHSSHRQSRQSRDCARPYEFRTSTGQVAIWL